jgi:hypothetical protein
MHVERRLVEIVLTLSTAVVGLFLLWDALAHATNLMYFPLDIETGLKPAYGTPMYELAASVILTTVFLCFCVALLSAVLWLRMVREE